ncbi:hypothetical protein FJZ31_04815 [Candidatus Poribacteria bacterium]|nr:hypothetical protein [Candidatus Poribacteria bacterium]
MENIAGKGMEIRPREVRIYVTPDGREPFQEWFGGLKDQKVRSAVLARIDRLRLPLISFDQTFLS